MKDISDIAQRTEVKVLSVKPGQKESAADYARDSFEVSVSAPGYDALARFINTIETYNNVYMVDSLDIGSQAEAHKSGLTVNLRISSVAAGNQ